MSNKRREVKGFDVSRYTDLSAQHRHLCVSHCNTLHLSPCSLTISVYFPSPILHISPISVLIFSLAMAASSSTAAAASNSTSANLNPNSDYDVFINHRGPDVKKTFASYLYRRLSSFGLRVFLDQQELQQGDYLTSQIEGAIQTASVHVAVFSQGYAESTWCLNELLLMLESKTPIIPVFFQVKPSELRWTKSKDGVYAKALHNLEEKTTCDAQTGQETLRYDSGTIEHWRNALSIVAGISGFELEACNGDEGELLEKVVESVLRKVKKTQLNVAKYPTGLDEKVKDFENKVLLQHHTGRIPKIVGIVGMGGAGKTTLAKELFNRKSSHYSRACFLSDVRENVSKGSLILLQNNLLKRLIGSDLQVYNEDEGYTFNAKKARDYCSGLKLN